MTWRTGTKLGRTLYKDEQLVGMVDTPELAAAIVAAMNGATAPEPRWTTALLGVLVVAFLGWAMLPVVAWMIGGYP